MSVRARASAVTASSELEARDEDGRTAFLRACREGDVEDIAALARAGCDKAAKDDGGATALMHAAHSGGVAAVRAVLDLGVAELDASNVVGSTAFLLACRC